MKARYQNGLAALEHIVVERRQRRRHARRPRRQGQFGGAHRVVPALRGGAGEHQGDVPRAVEGRARARGHRHRHGAAILGHGGRVHLQRQRRRRVVVQDRQRRVRRRGHALERHRAGDRHRFVRRVHLVVDRRDRHPAGALRRARREAQRRASEREVAGRPRLHGEGRDRHRERLADAGATLAVTLAMPPSSPIEAGASSSVTSGAASSSVIVTVRTMPNGAPS